MFSGAEKVDKMAEPSKHVLYELQKIPGNNKCCDCGRPEPQWASVNLGVFICEQCAGFHRALGSHISKVKSIQLDNWDEAALQQMSNKGNEKAKEYYEKSVPPHIRQPTQDDPLVLREQWIRAKYERKEYVGNTTASPNGVKEGYLWKRGKLDKKFNKRKFVLSEPDGTLKYFVKDTKTEPKATLRIDDLNVTLAPDKVGNHNGMQLTSDQEGHTRSLFVYAEEGKDLIDWYNAIRGAKLTRLSLAYPFQDVNELIKLLSRDFLKEGWLSKTGPRTGDAYRRRYIVLDKRKLMYYEDPMDAFPKGEIFLGNKEKGFAVREGVPPNIKSIGFPFTLKTPERRFHFSAETQQEQMEWMQILQDVVAQPMSLQDNSCMLRSGKR